MHRVSHLLLSSVSPGAGTASKMIKSFKLGDVVSHCGAHDTIFARKMSGGGCQFFAWPGVDPLTTVRGILTMPPHLQTIHVLFGRRDVPVDICLDIDRPVPSEIMSVDSVIAYQRKVLRQHIEELHEAIRKEGETVESQVALVSPNIKKVSFHLHIKLKDAAFSDFNSLQGFLAHIKSNGGIPDADLQIYRPNGMLRMYKSKKENLQCPMSLVDDTSSHVGFESNDRRLPNDEQAAVHSLCIRPIGTYNRLIRKQSIRFDYAEAMKQKAAPAPGSDTKKFAATAPRTKTEACETALMWLKATPPEMVTEWRQWIGLGMNTFRVAHHFRNENVPSFQGQPVMDVLLNAWIETSKKVPQKFVSGDCEKSWASFSPDDKPDAWWTSYRALCNYANGMKK